MSAQNKKDEIKATVERLRQSNNDLNQTTGIYNVTRQKPLVEKKRVSSTTDKITTQERKTVMNNLIRQLLLGEISQGIALKQFRIHIMGLKQDAYAELVSVSRKTLSDIENDKGNYSVEVINRIYKPLGLQIGLIPIAKSLLTTLLSSE
ncbi:helix-turn-helix transcriptional regulator [Kluyvera sp. CHPC 1.2972]|uniref:helix-turn-helix transcriptional regulator n=1 Tax=Kluyvera sp. CHPC 1.2972 TaxID=2995176 RepID=UPI002FD86C88